MRFIAKNINIFHPRISFRLFAFACLFPTLAFACDKTLVISASKNWQPYSYKMHEEYKGLDIEVLELILEKAGWCWQFITLPSSSRAFAELKKGNLDMIFAASMSQERAEHAWFTVPYRKEYSKLYTHIDNNSKLKLGENTMVAVNRGGFYGEAFAKYRQECTNCVVDVSLASQRFFLLKNKRVDFVIEDSLAGKYVLANYEYADLIKQTDQVVHDNMVHYMIAKDSLSESQLTKLNKVIEQNQDEIDSLVRKYHDNLLN